MLSGARPTARDVAGLAGVSVATVSYVLNDRPGRVGSGTRERVLAAVRELGYAPNRSARGLRRQRTDQVCLVVGSLGVPSNDQLARQLHQAADEAGYGVVTLLVDSEARAHHACDLLQQGIADGAVISDPYHCLGRERLTGLARRGLSLVAMDNSVAPEGFDVVRVPEREVCGAALDSVLSTGRRRLAFIGHHSDLQGSVPGERLAAYHDAVARHHLIPDDRLVLAGADDRADSYWAVTGLLQLQDPPDAVFCASDRAAVSAIWAIRDAGLSVPHDVAVLGTGNLKEGLITRPALSTVGQPALDFSEVVGLLFDRLAAPAPPDGRELVLPWTFIRRGST